MKTLGPVMLLFIGLTLMGSGGASVRPPTADEAYWESQQSDHVQDVNPYDSLSCFGRQANNEAQREDRLQIFRRVKQKASFAAAAGRPFNSPTRFLPS
ncbi:MAG TPA: hypothetical protein VGI63_05540 [Verrucomicrobiae bacterium]|jgi:uncharacterized protein YjhX (UPF0386 family)